MKDNKILKTERIHTFYFKYLIINYSNIYKCWELINVDLDCEIYDGGAWYFVLKDELGKEYHRFLEEIYGTEDINYLKYKVNKLNKGEKK